MNLVITKKSHSRQMKQMDGMHQCRFHGRQTYLRSDTAHGELCLECVRLGYYNKDVEREFIRKYPNLMNPL